MVILRTNRTSADTDQMRNRQMYLSNGLSGAGALISLIISGGSGLLSAVLMETGVCWPVEIVFASGAVSNLSNRLPTIVVSGVKGSRNRSAAMIKM